MVVPRFVSEAINNEPITVFGDGQQVRSFCDVRDLVEIIQKLSDNQNAVGHVFNVGREEPITIMDLALLVKNAASSHSEITYTPLEKAYSHEYIEMVHREPDLTKLKRYINFTYRWSLKSTIENLIELGRKHEK
jgi:UDP-glucose 4-epimerase